MTRADGSVGLYGALEPEKGLIKSLISALIYAQLVVKLVTTFSFLQKEYQGRQHYLPLW
jgi:hypothetical protein